MTRATSERGTTFVELMGAITIISIATLVMLQQLTISYREGSVQQDRLWVYDKGTQILAELQSGIERGTIPDAEALHALADTDLNPVLTTITDEYGQPLPADHPMSGNWQRFGRWVWARQLAVESPPGQDRIRVVRLKIVKYNDSGVPLVVAPLTTVVTLPRRTYPSTVVYDVYALALAEVPSPLGSLAALRSSVEARLRAASSDAPGIEFRLHWVTRLAYGRDSLYTPYCNDGVTAATATPWVYWYPTQIDTGTTLFHSELFTGRVRTDAGVLHDYDSSTCPQPHAVADLFNHAMRLPAARSLFQARVAAGLDDAAEPPLQILLADMVEHPERFRNALVLNLHGDGLPFPPVRNYSDAAAAPGVVPGVRVVTHPTEICTPRDPNGDGNHADSEDVELRVYAYKQDPATGDPLLVEPITVQIFGGDFRSVLAVRRLPGGIDLATGSASTAVAYETFDSAGGTPPTSDPGNAGMWYEVGYTASPIAHTWVRLYNTPLTCPAASGQGLPTAQRLYGLEYVPTPLGATPFARDLAAVGTDAKNTARWRIRIAKAALGTLVPNVDQTLTVTTRIGGDLTTGTAWPIANQPRNASTTYAWWAASPDAVPPLERCQFLGDPRHNPYADVAASGRYNCCFAGSGIPLDAANWDAIDVTRLRETGFGDGLTADMPRALAAWRGALQAATAVFTNLTPLANRLYLGGEVAAVSSDGGITPGKVTMPGEWLGQTGAVLVDSVSNGPCTPAAPPLEPMASLLGEHVVLGPGTFWAKPWLGELAADTDYSLWFASGNLAASSGYRREVRAQSTPANLPTGAAFYGIGTGATAGAIGGTSLVQTGTLASTFAHQVLAGGTASTTTEGAVLPDLLGYKWAAMPPATRPFALTLPGSATAPHFLWPSEFPTQTAAILEAHLGSSGAGLSNGAVLRVADAAGATAFFEIASLMPANVTDIESLLDLGVAEQLRAFYAAGAPALTTRIEQPARVEIVDPPKGALASNPAAINITWRVDFLRADGQLPTAAYPTGFTEDESHLRYAVLYSLDAGKTWFNVVDDSAATPGVRPTGGLLLTDAGVGNESLNVPTPSSTFPAGELLLRVEAFHAVRDTHYGHHTVLVVVTR
ncbi:MAG: type II secretion system protein [Planctomycetota bacterium]